MQSTRVCQGASATTPGYETSMIIRSISAPRCLMVLSSMLASLIANIPINLLWPRDQISTKGLPDFIQTRGEVARLIRASSDDIKARCK